MSKELPELEQRLASLQNKITNNNAYLSDDPDGSGQRDVDRMTLVALELENRILRIRASKVMPCGFVKGGGLKRHLAHYRQCKHPACKARATEWDRMVKQYISET